MSTSPNRAVVLIGILIVVAIAAGLFLYSNRVDAPSVTEQPATSNAATTTDTAQNNTASTTEEVPSANTTTAAPTTPKPAPKPVATPKPVPVPTYGAVVSYTDGGFEPVRSTIFVGQTVRFVNNSDRKMWVAAAIHPTHTNYAEHSENDCLGSSFDQCTAVAKGQHWDFKFNVVGSWEFHNHMKGSDTGVIYVKERE